MDNMGRKHEFKYHPEKSKSVELRDLNPHYSNDRFKKPQTIFGEEEKGLWYDYSDRLISWYWDNQGVARDKANESGHARNSVNWLEVWMEGLCGKKVTIHHVVSGVNHSNGYPYFVLGYKVIE
jgi:hypothetical protein